MLEICAISFGPLSDLTGVNITVLVGNNNALGALVSNAPGPRVIAAMAQLIWRRIAGLNAAFWFEGVPSTRNIADLPTKMEILLFPSRHIANSKCLKRAFGLIAAATTAIANGQPAHPPH